ncbi:MAG: MmgE/PrpD family protein [Candidatus Binatia bacterium]
MTNAEAARTDPTSAVGACPPLERSLIRFIQGLGADRIGKETRAAVSCLLRDQLAVQIGSAGLPWSRQVLSFATASQLPGQSSVIASGVKMSAIGAAFVNSTYGHGFEYDDAHRESASHPGPCVVPTALAIGEELNATLDDVIAGIVAGYEVYTRIGCLAAPDLLKRGFHPHAILSSFGAAATAAKLRKLDPEKTMHTMAISVSHASGVTEYSSTGGSIKRVHSGMGVRSGMISADMAQFGITGPPAFLSGSKGFYRTFLQRSAGAEPERWFGPDHGFEIHKIWLKPYCCCGCTHAYIDAIRPFSARLSEIAKVAVKIQPSANVIVGTANANAYEPRTIENVQFSLPMQMTFALLGYGNGLRVHLDYLEGKLNMGTVLETARLIRIDEAPELDRQYAGKFVADVTVHFRNGQSEHVFVEDPIGTAENPMPESEQDAKFMESTSGVLGRDRAARLLSALQELDSGMPVAELTAMCTA